MNPARIKDRLRQYALLMRLDRPIGILLLLWPTLWALWIAAQGVPDIAILLIFVAGVVLMRSAGCVINDVADRRFDPLVARTRERPVAAGRVSPREAMVLFGLLCLLAFGLVLLLNRLTLWLSFAALALAVIYPLTKRVTHLPQLVLGAAFSMAIPMAFAAQTGAVPKVAWLLYVINLLWTVAYDTEYAMVDREDDLRAGVKSTAILFGAADRLVIGLLQLLVLAGLSLLAGPAGLGAYYGLGLLVAAGFALYQQYLLLEPKRETYFQAFLNNNWLGMAVFAGIALDYLALGTPG